jgi:hypothetical protein
MPRVKPDGEHLTVFYFRSVPGFTLEILNYWGNFLLHVWYQHIIFLVEESEVFVAGLIQPN